jgi:RimJ/RimL family protein N-acetyltransferase
VRSTADRWERPATGRLRLQRLGMARARAILAGDLSGVDAAPGWPHADSLDGIALEAEHAASDEQTSFLVVLVATGQVIGEAGWKGGPGADGETEIGYGLAAPSRGQGLGTELVALLTEWVLNQPGVTQVVASVLPGNAPSRRALERNGFQLDDRADAAAGDELRYVLRG